MAELVSVVIPTYNRAWCLPRAIDSVLAQTHREVEVVVVDDGSTDCTGAMIGQRYGSDTRVRYLAQANAGVASARNAGLDAAGGDYVALLDSDDWWHSWKLELQLRTLNAFPDAGMVWSEMEAVDAKGALVKNRYLRSYYLAYRWFPTPSDLFAEHRLVDGRTTAYAGDIYAKMIAGNLVHTSTVLLTRERLDKVGRFDLALQPTGEDYDFHLRTCREGPVAYLDAASIRYQMDTPDRLTHRRRTMASHFLLCIERELANNRARIDLPPAMLREVFADAYRWMGEIEEIEGNPAEARRHFLESLRRQPWQPRVAARLALCSLPAGAADLLRATWHRMKSA